MKLKDFYLNILSLLELSNDMAAWARQRELAESKDPVKAIKEIPMKKLLELINEFRAFLIEFSLMYTGEDPAPETKK